MRNHPFWGNNRLWTHKHALWFGFFPTAEGKDKWLIVRSVILTYRKQTFVSSSEPSFHTQGWKYNTCFKPHQLKYWWSTHWWRGQKSPCSSTRFGCLDVLRSSPVNGRSSCAATFSWNGSVFRQWLARVRRAAGGAFWKHDMTGTAGTHGRADPQNDEWTYKCLDYKHPGKPKTHNFLVIMGNNRNEHFFW